MNENDERQLQKIREKIAQMKSREKVIIARDRQRQRKARTRCLIQIGAIAEKYYDCEGIEPKEFEKMLKEKFEKSIDIIW